MPEHAMSFDFRRGSPQSTDDILQEAHRMFDASVGEIASTALQRVERQAAHLECAANGEEQRLWRRLREYCEAERHDRRAFVGDREGA